MCVHILFHTEQRKDQVTSCQDIIAMANADKYFLTKVLREMRLGVLPMTPKQSDSILNGLVRPQLKKLKFQRSRI
jgi:hypothetical protein